MEWWIGFLCGIGCAFVGLKLAEIKFRRHYTKADTPSASHNTGMDAIAFASSWCERYGWNPDVIENFADALVEWQQRHA